MRYLFGDSDIAARRLEMLDAVFAPPTEAFLADAVADPPRLALDLGCGPGYTTHRLARLLADAQVVGLDNSEHFLALARRTETDRVSFHLHDVTAMPFPVGPADLLYCRFLLTHMRDPPSVVAKWATQLRSQGVLLIEEVEWIRTDSAVFSTYLGIVEAMLASQSNTLFVGPVMDRWNAAGGLTKRMSRITRFPTTSDRAAALFVLNIRTWKEHPFVRANYHRTQIAQLEDDLQGLMRAPDGNVEIEWGLRQIVFERT